MRVAIFIGYPDSVERDINDWFARNKPSKVQALQSVDPGEPGYNPQLIITLFWT